MVTVVVNSIYCNLPFIFQGFIYVLSPLYVFSILSFSLESLSFAYMIMSTWNDKILSPITLYSYVGEKYSYGNLKDLISLYR